MMYDSTTMTYHTPWFCGEKFDIFELTTPYNHRWEVCEVYGPGSIRSRYYDTLKDAVVHGIKVGTENDVINMMVQMNEEAA